MQAIPSPAPAFLCFGAVQQGRVLVPGFAIRPAACSSAWAPSRKVALERDAETLSPGWECGLTQLETTCF